MDRLRSTLFESKALEARQELDDLLDAGAPLQHVLSTLHSTAACLRGPPPAEPTEEAIGPAHGLTLAYALDRSVDDLQRLGLLRPALHAVIDHLASSPLEPIEPLPDGEGDVAALPQAWEDGDVPRLAGALRALEDSRTERLARGALFDVVRRTRGPFGSRLVDAVAFLRGFERADAHGRGILAHAYARELVRSVADASSTTPDALEPPPLPGTASAGTLLAHLRDFHRPAARACLEALIAGGRAEEALTVLVQRAEENAGPRFHHLLLADAVHATFPLLGDTRDDHLRDLTDGLLRAEPSTRLVDRLADRVAERLPDGPLRARERHTREERLADALARQDRDAAVESAGVLLADEAGGDALRRAVLAFAFSLDERHVPRAPAAVAALLALARAVGWPAARGSLLRAVDLLAAECGP